MKSSFSPFSTASISFLTISVMALYRRRFSSSSSILSAFTFAGLSRFFATGTAGWSLPTSSDEWLLSVVLLMCECCLITSA